MSVNVIGQVAWVATYAFHHMWNCIHMQLMQLSYNYVEGSYLSNSKLINIPNNTIDTKRGLNHY